MQLQRSAAQQRLEGNEGFERAREEARQVSAPIKEVPHVLAKETQQVAVALEEERRLHEERTRALQAEILELQRRLA